MTEPRPTQRAFLVRVAIAVLATASVGCHASDDAFDAPSSALSSDATRDASGPAPDAAALLDAGAGISHPVSPDGQAADGGDEAVDGSADGNASNDDASSTPPTPGASVLGLDPPMGWSTWSFLRRNPTEATVEAQAQAMHDSHLAAHGYVYVNLDDFYYLDPTSNVDAYGRWVVDTSGFPHGMAALGAFVHGLGLRFGMYVTAGVPVAAVKQNTPIEGTPYFAASIADVSTYETQYNFTQSMYGIDYTKPGAQAFIDSWAELLASYGVDYLKIDGVGSSDIPDVSAWSAALRKTGRPIHFELSNNLSVLDASTWQTLANGWRIGPDIECYCSILGTSYPLTDWLGVDLRFDQAAQWQPYSQPNGRNDLDSIEIGNGDDDGLTPDERTTQMTLWALAASPLLLGTDLTNLDPGDLALLTNDEVIAVDQAGVAAKQLTTGDTQAWAAPEPDGSYAVGLFNLGASPATVSVTWADLGLQASAAVRDLSAHTDRGTFTGSYESEVPSHGAVLLRIAP